jgi:hypothetical protein
MLELIEEEELLKHVPMTPRLLRELRYQRKIPFVRLSYRAIRYDLKKVMAAIERLEIKEIA